MNENFRINTELGFSIRDLPGIIQQINKQISSIKPINIPVNVVGASGGSRTSPLASSSIAKNLNLTQPIAQMGKLKAATTQVTNEFEKFGQQAAMTVKRFSAFILVVNAFNSLTNALGRSFSEAIKFEKEMAKISQVTGSSISGLSGLNREITRLSTGLGVSSEKITNVALTLAQAGLSAKETKTALDVLAKTELSATFEDITQTTEAAIAVIAQFGTTTEDLKGQLGAMNSVAAKFAVESSDLATVVRRAGGAFAATGGDLNELLALFTSVRATTRESAESISTGLRTIFTRLQRTRTLNFLSDLGVDLRNAKGEFIGIYPAIAKLSSALKDVSGNDPRFNQIVEELGGFRQVSKVIPLLKQFEVSQRALNVAKQAGDSIDRDAIIAQKTLANQISKVREEFDALIRSYMDDGPIKTLIQGTLQLASALIKVGDAIRPLGLALTALGGIGLLNVAGTVGRGFAPGIFKPPIKRARGGMVPGSGSGDTVPAMLEPGEFVLRKSAVQALGAGNVAGINKYAGGGRVTDMIKYLRVTRAKSASQGWFHAPPLNPNDSLKNQVVVPFKNLLKSGTGSILGLGNTALSGIGSGIGATVRGATRLGGAAVRGIGNLASDFIPPARPLTRNEIFLKESKKILRQAERELGGKFAPGFLSGGLRITSSISQSEKAALSKIGAKSFTGYYNTKNDGIVINSSKINDIRHLRRVIYHELGHAIQNKVGKNFASNKRDSLFRSAKEASDRVGNAFIGGRREYDSNIGRKTSEKYGNYRYSSREGFAEAVSARIRTRQNLDKAVILGKGRSKTSDVIDNLLLNSGVLRKFAVGGGVGGSGSGDTVPALLTPGEFVINKRSAKAFGYGNLEKVNRYNDGGPVRPFPHMPNKKRGSYSGPGPTYGYSVNTPEPYVGTFPHMPNTAGGNYSNPATPIPVKVVSTASGTAPNSSSVRGGGGIGLGGAGLALGFAPAAIEQITSNYSKETQEAIKPFISSVTAAGAVLLTFAYALKKNTVETSESLSELATTSGKTNSELSHISAARKVLEAEVKANTTPVHDPFSGEFRGEILNNKGKEAQDALGGIIAKEKELIDLKKKHDEELFATHKKLLDEENHNKIGQGVAIGGAIAVALGSILSSYAQNSAQKGNKSAIPLAGAAGFLSGAGGGALAGFGIGSLIPVPGAGLVGAGIGAAGGGIISAVSGVNSAQSAVRDFELNKLSENLNSSLSKISTGKSTIGAQGLNIKESLSAINKRFLEETDDGVQSLKASIGPTADGLESMLIELTKSASTLKDFKVKNEDLILVLTRLGGKTIQELDDTINTGIKSQKRYQKQIELNTANEERLSAIFDISGAVGDAERSIHKLSHSLDALEQIISGNFSSKTNFNFSALNNIGASRFSDVQDQATRAGGLIGGAGGGIAKDVIEAAKLSKQVPLLLHEIVSGNQLEGEDIRDKIRSKFGKGFAADLLTSAIDKEIGATGSSTELIGKFREDPVGLAKRIQAALDPIVDVLKNEAPKIAEQFDLYSAGLATARQNFLASLDGLNKAVDIQQVGAELRASASGRSTTFAQDVGFDNARFNNLVGPNQNAGSLGTRLGTAQSNILSLEALKNTTTDKDELKKLTKELEKNYTEAQVVGQGLSHLADVNSRLASVNKELQRLTAERQNKATLAEDFAFGDPAAQRDIFKGLIGVRTILTNLQSGKGGLSGLSNEQKKLAQDVLTRFENDRVFNGKTGREIKNEVTGVGNVPGEEEKSVRAIADSIVSAAETAQGILNTNLTSNNERFLSGLETKLNTFLSELQISLKERETDRTAEKNAIRDVSVDAVSNKIDLLKKVGRATGLNMNDAGSVSTVQKAIADVERARKLSDSNTSLVEAGKAFKQRGFKGTNELEGMLGPDFAKEFKTRVANGKAIGVGPEAILNDIIAKQTKKNDRESNTILGEVDERVPGILKGIIPNLQEFSTGLKDIKETLKELRGKRQALINPERLAGGGVIWKKRGTDTVPAMTTDGQPFMLTPGEMVMRRSAVAKYGPQLRKMNYASGGFTIRGKHYDDAPTIYDRASAQTTRFNEAMKASQIQRGFSPKLDSNGNVDATGNTRKTGMYDITRTKIGSPYTGKNIAKRVPSHNEIMDARQSERGGYDVTSGSFGMGRRATIDSVRANYQFQSPRAVAAREAKEQRLQSIKDAKQAKADFFANKKNGGQGFFNVPAEGGQSPQVVKELNEIVNKLGGTKLELAISGTVDVRIIEGNLGDSIKAKFETAITAYVDDKITTALNDFGKANNLAFAPAPVGVKKKESK